MTTHNIYVFIPFIILIFIVIISGFIANFIKFIIIKIEIKYFRKKVIKDFIITETENCCICLDNMEKDTIVSVLICNHLFHKECIKEWYENKQNCPLCRLELNDNAIEVV